MSKKGFPFDRNPKLFSSERQPTPEQRKKGGRALARTYALREAKKQFLENMCKMELPDGTIINFWDEVRKRLQLAVLDKNSPLTYKEKIQLMVTICEKFLPEDKKENMGNEVKIIINKEDANL